MRIEYPDGKIHNVDCYAFKEARVDNQFINYIEYKDYDNNRDGEYTDSYAIVVFNNGHWQKSTMRIDYQTLAKNTVRVLDLKLLGDYIGLYKDNTYTEDYQLRTLTQPYRYKDDNDYTPNKRVIYIPVKTDSNKEIVDTHQMLILNYSSLLCGFSFTCIKREKIDSFSEKSKDNFYSSYSPDEKYSHDKDITFASFESITTFAIPDRILRLVTSENSFEKLRETNIEEDGVIYKFVPASEFIINTMNQITLDISISEDEMNFPPEEILERFYDYRIKRGRINHERWLGYTTKAEIKKLKEENARLTDEVEYLRDLLNEQKDHGIDDGEASFTR